MKHLQINYLCIKYNVHCNFIDIINTVNINLNEMDNALFEQFIVVHDCGDGIVIAYIVINVNDIAGLVVVSSNLTCLFDLKIVVVDDIYIE